MSEISQEEKTIIDDAIRNADVFGAGRLTYAKEAIEDEGYDWTDDHEQYVGNVKTASELKFSSENEALQHLANITGKSIKIAAESLLYSIIDRDEFNQLKDNVDEQTFKLAQKVMIKLATELKLTDKQNEAINRLKQSISGHISNEAQHRNNIFKAANVLGISLPSSSF